MLNGCMVIIYHISYIGTTISHILAMRLYQLYQIETVPMPITDQNTEAHSYTHLWVDRPYIALHLETYITIRQQELRTCKRIEYEFSVRNSL